MFGGRAAASSGSVRGHRTFDRLRITQYCLHNVSALKAPLNQSFITNDKIVRGLEKTSRFSLTMPSLIGMPVEDEVPLTGGRRFPKSTTTPKALGRWRIHFRYHTFYDGTMD